jgi:hypothetical protein
MKIYPLGLVGESNYQTAISETYVGGLVRICHEPDNPYDELALRAENGAGEVIGYIPRTSWLRDAVFGSGRGCAATVREIMEGPDGMLGVVINVTLTDDLIPERSYAPKPTESEVPADSGLAGFVRGVFKALRS